MPVNARWYNEAHTIVCVQFSEPWTLPELVAAIQESRELQGSVSHQVDAIWDSTHVKTLPSNVLSHFMLSPQSLESPANQRALVIVAQNILVKTFISSAKRAMPHATRSMYVAETMEAAEKKIATLRPASSSLPA